jgi:hypothetical protein
VLDNSISPKDLNEASNYFGGDYGQDIDKVDITKSYESKIILEYAAQAQIYNKIMYVKKDNKPYTTDEPTL